ncbi:MAG: NAD(P)H-dependent glycerol-3-phosphate dehydrogenase [bacterium]|nr:NAD(P)H-dependent glycerol-3-phosphate dehydrogenase [bacterium]
MSKKTPIAILGAGAMGCAVAKLLERHKRPIRLFDVDPKTVSAINEQHENPVCMPGIKLAANVTATSNIADALKDAEVVFMIIPSTFVRETMQKAAPYLLPDAVIVNISKGLDEQTLLPPILSDGILPATNQSRVVVVGGPAIASDLCSNCPTGLVIASADGKARRIVKKLLESDTIKIATSKDMKGVGLAAALKNTYAIALGMCDGLKLSTNAKALILTLALQEMTNIIVALKGKSATASGLAGLGDLVVTGFSPQSRNRTYGEKLAEATTNDPTALGLPTVEGIPATNLAVKLVTREHVDAPLLMSIHACLQMTTNFTQPFQTFVKTLRLP